MIILQLLSEWVLFHRFIRRKSPLLPAFAANTLRRPKATIYTPYMKEARQAAKQLAPGDLVRVVQRSAPEAIKQRRYRIVKINTQYELLHLVWLDAPEGAKDRYEWVLQDFVRLL